MDTSFDRLLVHYNATTSIVSCFFEIFRVKIKEITAHVSNKKIAE